MSKRWGGGGEGFLLHAYCDVESAVNAGDNHLGTAIKDLAAAFTHDLNTSGKVSAQTVHDGTPLGRHVVVVPSHG